MEIDFKSDILLLTPNIDVLTEGCENASKLMHVCLILLNINILVKVVNFADWFLNQIEVIEHCYKPFHAVIPRRLCQLHLKIGGV